MPHDLVRAPGHDRSRSLGWFVAWWIESFTVHGPGAVQGDAVTLTDEQVGFLSDAYALEESGRRLYTSAFFSRPKGADKSGLAGKIVLAEAFAPVRFSHFAEAGETFTFLGRTYEFEAGEPVGVPVRVPFIRIMATEEDQAGNTYDTVYFNLTDDAAPLSVMRGLGCVPGLLRTVLPHGGEITPSTTGASSKDGGKETFFVADESHLFTTPALKSAYRTIQRNLVKRAREGVWLLETSTMFTPGEDSVGEQTYQEAVRIREGRSRRSRLLFDHRFGSLLDEQGAPVELDDEAALTRALTDAYGDAVAWVDIPAVIDLIYDARTPVNESYRYFLNAIHDAKDQWLPNALLQAAEDRARRMRPLIDGDAVVMAFDGSRSDDATVLVLCRVEDGLIALHHIQEIPDGPEQEGWQVDREAVDAAVSDAFERFDVQAFYGDPPFYQDYLDAWQKEFGERLLVKASHQHAIEWWTNRETQMVNAVDRLAAAFADGSASVVPGSALSRHLVNARSWRRRQGIVIGKEAKGSARKVDAAVAACIAWTARSELSSRGKQKEEPTRYMRVPIRVR